MATYIMVDDEPILVAHLFDVEGKETTDTDLAVTFVARPLPDGQWMGGDWSRYEPLVPN